MKQRTLTLDRNTFSVVASMRNRMRYSSANAERLVDVSHAFGFSVPELSKALFMQENKIVRMGAPSMRIEILTGISGVTFAECYNARVEDEIDGIPVTLIGLEHLKLNKKATGRYKDLSDLEHLP
ncbi:hypothetical protein GC175_14060 [bacterium]|nr:hypothetical protein [bacterium]